MTPVAPELRLSAQRALLGAIFPEVRLVKVKQTGSTIVVTSFIERVRDECVDALSSAAAEIIADFPECNAEGWVYQRAAS